MPARLAEKDQMTVEEFLAFMDSRPDGERWELIEGVAVLNAAPTQWHRVIAANILAGLIDHKRATDAAWTPMLGVGTRVPASPRSLPQPDVYVQAGPPDDVATTDDALVVFEILSRSNTKADRAWRKRVYASISDCQHYVTVSARSLEVARYDRADGWAGTQVTSLEAKLALPAIGATLPLRDIYRWTNIA
ncbi:MAG: Uma2 family endonuclease [Hyphomicrobiales bacterium]|nr:Uma2 family endonuclease [Hyphomicrobiales bacterium]